MNSAWPAQGLFFLSDVTCLSFFNWDDIDHEVPHVTVFLNLLDSEYSFCGLCMLLVHQTIRYIYKMHSAFISS